MEDLSRRTLLGGLGLATLAAARLAEAQAPPAQKPASAPASVPAFAAAHQTKPLPFDPSKLDGLSEKLIRSHWENNYRGSVNALNMVETRLAAAMADAELPPVIYGGLKREQLHRTGSVVLHELYFGALGGNGQPEGEIRESLARTHGSHAAWEAEFRRTALSLAGGSGWCVLAWSFHDGALHNYWASDHMQQPAGSVPLIALDMYEHSFHMDYGAAAARYVDAFMRNLDWKIVEQRHAAVRNLKSA